MATNTDEKVMDYAMVMKCLDELEKSSPENRNMISFLKVMFAQINEKERMVLHVLITDTKPPSRGMLRTTHMTHVKAVGSFKNILRRMGNSDSEISSIVAKNEAMYDGLVKQFALSVGEDLTTYLVNKYFVLSNVI